MDRAKYRGLRTDGKGWVYGMPTYDFKYIFNESSLDSPDNYEVIPETVGILLHTSRDKQEWYKGDVVEISIYVPSTGYHDGNGWLNNDDGFEGTAVGTLTFHPKYGVCIENYTLTDLNTDEEVEKKSKFKTVAFTRSKIVGNIYEKGGEDV